MPYGEPALGFRKGVQEQNCRGIARWPWGLTHCVSIIYNVTKSKSVRSEKNVCKFKGPKNKEYSTLKIQTYDSFYKEQLSVVMCKHAEKENGLYDHMEIMLESLMLEERGEFLSEEHLCTWKETFY